MQFVAHLDLITVCLKNKWKTKKIKRWNHSSWEDWLVYSRVRSLLVKLVLFTRKVFKVKRGMNGTITYGVPVIRSEFYQFPRFPQSRCGISALPILEIENCSIKIFIRSDRRVHIWFAQIWKVTLFVASYPNSAWCSPEQFVEELMKKALKTLFSYIS